MESESLQPHLSPERVGAEQRERNEDTPLQSPEVGLENGTERFERRSEAGAGSGDNSFVLPPPVVAAPLGPVATDDAGSVIGDAPLIANDDDLIEKEWVDKAKKIILDTKDDPYRREEAVGELQRDYLEKRYGRRIGSADDEV